MNPSQDELLKMAQETLAQCTNDIYYGAPNRTVCTLARYVLDRLGEQGKLLERIELLDAVARRETDRAELYFNERIDLREALRKLAITITNVSIKSDGFKRVHHCAVCSSRCLNDDERHETDCVLHVPSAIRAPSSIDLVPVQETDDDTNELAQALTESDDGEQTPALQEKALDE